MDKPTSLEQFVLDFLQSAELAERSREPEQLWLEIPRDFLLRARRLAKLIHGRQTRNGSAPTIPPAADPEAIAREIELYCSDCFIDVKAAAAIIASALAASEARGRAGTRAAGLTI